MFYAAIAVWNLQNSYRPKRVETEGQNNIDEVMDKAT